MKRISQVKTLLLLAAMTQAAGVRGDDTGRCRDQAEQILARFQAEVVGELSVDQRASANRIILDVCQVREQQVEMEMEKAVQTAKEEEQEDSNSWFSGSGDKPGNERLKRRTH